MFCKFKIYDINKKHSYQVYVFNKREEMIEHFNEETEFRFEDDVIDLLAMVYTNYKTLKSGKISKNIGSVYFNKEDINYGIIAHEMLHCSMDFDREINDNMFATYGDGNCDKDDEERLAYLLQSFTEDCLSMLVKKKVF